MAWAGKYQACAGPSDLRHRNIATTSLKFLETLKVPGGNL